VYCWIRNGYYIGNGVALQHVNIAPIGYRVNDKRKKERLMTKPSTQAPYDIVIGGGGYTGLTMARALSATLGTSVRIAVVDKGDLTASGNWVADPRAFAISSGAKRMLDVLDIWQPLADHAQAVSDIEITDSSLGNAVRPPVLSYNNKVKDGEPASYILETSYLTEALLKSVSTDPAITLIGGAAIERFNADAAGVEITLSNERNINAALLIAADGRNSRLRQSAGIKTVEWDHGQIGIVTIVAHNKPHEGRAVQHFLPSGPFAILPLPENRSCVTWSEEAATGRAVMALDDDGFLGELRQRFGYRLGEITLAGKRGSWPLTTSLARSYIARRLALVGDAAHGVHPIAGQGFNLAMRDVAALCEVLAHSARLGIDLGGGEALERYERWRRFDSAASAFAFSGLNKLFSNDWTLARTLRDAGMGVVDRLPGLKRMFVEEAGGLTGDVPRLLKGELV